MPSDPNDIPWFGEAAYEVDDLLHDRIPRKDYIRSLLRYLRVPQPEGDPSGDSSFNSDPDGDRSEDFATDVLRDILQHTYSHVTFMFKVPSSCLAMLDKHRNNLTFVRYTKDSGRSFKLDLGSDCILTLERTPRDIDNEAEYAKTVLIEQCSLLNTGATDTNDSCDKAFHIWSPTITEYTMMHGSCQALNSNVPDLQEKQHAMSLKCSSAFRPSQALRDCYVSYYNGMWFRDPAMTKSFSLAEDFLHEATDAAYIVRKSLQYLSEFRDEYVYELSRIIEGIKVVRKKKSAGLKTLQDAHNFPATGATAGRRLHFYYYDHMMALSDLLPCIPTAAMLDQYKKSIKVIQEKSGASDEEGSDNAFKKPVTKNSFSTVVDAIARSAAEQDRRISALKDSLARLQKQEYKRPSQQSETRKPKQAPELAQRQSAMGSLNRLLQGRPSTSMFASALSTTAPRSQGVSSSVAPPRTQASNLEIASMRHPPAALEKQTTKPSDAATRKSITEQLSSLPMKEIQNEAKMLQDNLEKCRQTKEEVLKEYAAAPCRPSKNRDTMDPLAKLCAARLRQLQSDTHCQSSKGVDIYRKLHEEITVDQFPEELRRIQEQLLEYPFAGSIRDLAYCLWLFIDTSSIIKTLCTSVELYYRSPLFAQSDGNGFRRRSPILQAEPAPLGSSVSSRAWSNRPEEYLRMVLGFLSDEQRRTFTKLIEYNKSFAEATCSSQGSVLKDES